MGANFGRDIKRAGLAVLTSGTSEIKTGGGVYGDETVADNLFPKAINDWALEGRKGEREAKDKAAADEKAALEAQKPPPPMDFTDETLSAARQSSLLRIKSGRNLGSTFGTRTSVLGG